MIRVLAFGIGMPAAFFIVACAFLYFSQDDILFHRIVNDRVLAARWLPHKVAIPAGEVVVEGWWAENPLGKPLTIVYFGGNAEDVLYAAEAAAQISAHRMLVTNYRGCGATPGKPGEEVLFKDALAIYDYAVSLRGSSNAIIVMGRSLGSGEATFVAAHRPVRGVILITPYDNMASVAQAHYPYFPVRWLLRNRFPSDDFASKVKAPVLMIAGARDGIVPPVHARQLFQIWAGPKDLQILQDAGHNNISKHPLYYPLINAFLDRNSVQPHFSN